MFVTVLVLDALSTERLWEAINLIYVYHCFFFFSINYLQKGFKDQFTPKC